MRQGDGWLVRAVAAVVGIGTLINSVFYPRIFLGAVTGLYVAFIIFHYKRSFRLKNLVQYHADCRHTMLVHQENWHMEACPPTELANNRPLEFGF